MSFSNSPTLNFRWLLCLAGAAIVFLLPVGCRGIGPTVSTVTAPTEHQFRIQGRISAVTSSESFKGSFEWLQKPTDFSMILRGSLGFGKVVISGDDNIVSFARGRDDVVEGIELSELMESQLGWSIPLGDLRRLLFLSTPVSDLQQPVFDDEGRLSDFKFRDWAVNFDRYLEVGGRSLPSRINLVQRKVKIRLIIDEWLEVNVRKGSL